MKRIARPDWIKLADTSKLPQKYVLDRLDALLPRIPAAVARVGEHAIADGLPSETVEPLVTRIIERSDECAERMIQNSTFD